jgi:hypothetical protein
MATRPNLHTWQATCELAAALGLDGRMFDRFDPGGRGRANLELLQASPQDMAAAEVCCGSTTALDLFVSANKDRAVRPG